MINIHTLPIGTRLRHQDGRLGTYTGPGEPWSFGATVHWDTDPEEVVHDIKPALLTVV